MKHEELLARLDSWQGELCHKGTPKYECYEAAAAIREREAEVERLRIELSLERDASANLEAEIERLRRLLDCRAGRLLERGVPFFVVKASEPYARAVVNLIKEHEGTAWTNEDQQWADAALGEQAGQPLVRAWTPPRHHCQNGSDICLRGNKDGITCPEDSCDIDDGLYPNPVAV